MLRSFSLYSLPIPQLWHQKSWKELAFYMSNSSTKTLRILLNDLIFWLISKVSAKILVGFFLSLSTIIYKLRQYRLSFINGKTYYFWQKRSLTKALSFKFFFSNSNIKNWSYFSFYIIKTTLSKAKSNDHQEVPSKKSNSLL